MKKLLLLLVASMSLGLSSCYRIVDDILYYTTEYLYMEYIGGYPNFYYRAGPARFDGYVYEWGNILYFTTNADFLVSVRLERYQYYPLVGYDLPGYATMAPYQTYVYNNGRSISCNYHGARIVVHLNDY